MMDYSKLSDFEINKLVASFVDFGGLVVSTNESNETVYLSEQDGLFDVVPIGFFNPCNNPSDAWPIIVDNQIVIIPPVSNGTNGWKAERFYNENCGKLIDCIDKNPLRAAMIVYLMMQEDK